MIKYTLKKSWRSGGRTFILDVTDQFPLGSFTGIYGPSGAGKTSLLRLLAGLEKPDKGHMKVDKTFWVDTEKSVLLPPQKRSIGFLFQQYSLFPNMTIQQQLEYAAVGATQQNDITALLEITGLTHLKNQKPATLSGGEQQRAALARALVRRPTLLLLDEPLTALDPDRRHLLQDYIASIHQQYQLTTIMISHDTAELAKLCDRVLCMEQGKIIRSGNPVVLFDEHQTMDLANRTGRVLAITHKDGRLLVDLANENGNVQLYLQPGLYPELKTGDYIELAPAAFQIIKNDPPVE